MRPASHNLLALREQLNAEERACLDRTGALPAELRARLGADLRAHLAGCIACIPAPLVRAHLADPRPGCVRGAFWQGSLLCADLSGFTALAEQLSVLGRQGAEELSIVVSQLFDALLAEVHCRQGTLLKFGGDALTAFFDDAHLGPQHAAAAAAAALAMQQCMATFAGLQTRAGSFTLRLRVAVHSGRVFAAELGDASHIELLITGPEVNRVAVAQELAEPGQVLVSDQTAALIPDVTLRPARGGFHAIQALPEPDLPPPLPAPQPASGPDDLTTLARLAEQLAALRPYLVRGLPRRFLSAAASGPGEFRPVSVLFANVQDFSPLLATLSDAPDTAAAIVNAYYQQAQAVVHHYDGIVNKLDLATRGDKLMALFGAPAAHEDDPIRAVRCALELRAALAAANEAIARLIAKHRVRIAGESGDEQLATSAMPRLSQRIGLASGTLFAGRVGGATRYEYTVMGPAVNLAARLMAAADDGEILLSPSVRAAVAGQMLLEEAPPLRLRGIATPVQPARALRMAEGAGSARGTASAARLATAPLIGRDAELGAMLAAGRSALAGRGGVIAIVGEAGTGKTRLAAEVLQHLVRASASPGAERVPPFGCFLGEAQSYAQRTPYAALRTALDELLGRGAQGADQPFAAHLARRVGELAPALVRFAPLLADALGLAPDDSALTAALTPQQRHDRLQELVVALFQGAARHEPLLLMVEDLHWADLASQELLGRLATAVADLPILLVLTYRPEPPIAAPWDTLAHTRRLHLGELSAEDSAALLGALLGGSPPPTLLALLERAQGNPFFIEELVRALVAEGVLSREASGAWRLARRPDEVELPTSVEGLLLARLDRLDEPRRELVQLASVIGRRFPYPLLAEVYAGPTPLDTSLQRLVDLEVLQADHADGDQAYRFRHALLRDVAYAGILYVQRRALHSRVARSIATGPHDRSDEQLALLAWHYLHAEEWAPALDFHLRAADQAARRFANRDALALYATALTVAERLGAQPTATDLPNRLAEIHERSGELQLLLGEYDAAEAHFRSALAQVGAAASEPWLRLHRLLASVEERRSRYAAAFEWLQIGLARANSALRLEAARCYLLGAGIHFRQGAYTRAMEWATMGLRLAERIGSLVDQAHAFKLIGNLYRDQGDNLRAIEALESARTRFARLNILSGQSDTLNNLGILYTRLGRWPETIASFEQSMQLSESIGDVQAVARTANNLAVVLVGRDQLQRAEELYRMSGELFGRIGSALGVAVTTQNRGEVLLLQGQPAAARALVAAALASYERISARNFLPEALRLAAEIALTLGDLAGARDAVEQALAVADELGMAPEAAAARRVRGQVALATGDLVTAAEDLAQSRAELARLDGRYELGKTCYHQARLALARGDSAAFAAARAEALAIFTELDARRDLELVQAL